MGGLHTSATPLQPTDGLKVRNGRQAVSGVIWMPGLLFHRREPPANSMAVLLQLVISDAGR